METAPTGQEAHQPVLFLGWDGGRRFEVDANILATGRTCVIGSSGSGKSYTVGVISEELCKNQVPFAIVDTEGEHSGLKEKYEAIWVGDDGDADLRWSTVDLGQLASQAPDIAPLILDLSESENPKETIGVLLTSLYQEVERRKTPYLVIVEEADRFMPQNGDRVPIFGEVARRGRKRGMGLMVCTQRPSLIDKNILSQCGNQLIGKLVIKNDLQAVAQFFSGHELPKYLTTLEPGKFFVMGGLSAAPTFISVRTKDTRNGGSAPRLVTRILKPFSSLPTAVPRQGGSDPPAQAREVGAGLLGINPTFNTDDVPDIVRRDKSFIFFGKKEVVADAQAVFRPLVEVSVDVKTGRIKKRMGMKHLILDGQTGRFVDLGDAPVMHEGFQRLMGLNSGQIEILRTTSPDKEMSLLEIADKVGVSKDVLRRPIRLLEEKRLIRSFQVGKAKVYRRIFDFPELRWHDEEQPLEAVMASQAKVEEYKLDEENVRDVIKGLIPSSDVQGFKRFLYPLYRVELVRNRKRRVVWLDGTTGKEFHL